MHSRSQTSSEEEQLTPAPRLNTPQEIAAWVASVDETHGSEWLTAVYLGSQGEVLGKHTLFQGDQCGLSDPEPCLPAMIEHAVKLDTAYLLTVRHHNHRWPGPSPRGQARLKLIEAQVQEAGIRLLGSVVQDATGEVHTVMFDQTEGGKSGSSGPISRPR